MKRKRYSPEFVLPLLDEFTCAPVIDDLALENMNRCDSLLEVIYLYGAFVSMFELAHKSDPGFALEFYGHGDGWTPSCAWDAFGGYGPSSVVIRPQVTIGGLRRDFGIYLGSDNCPSSAAHLWVAVEIDGWNVHRGRRADDARRDAECSVPVLRIQEELVNPKEWWGDLIIRWNDI